MNEDLFKFCYFVDFRRFSDRLLHCNDFLRNSDILSRSCNRTISRFGRNDSRRTALSDPERSVHLVDLNLFDCICSILNCFTAFVWFEIVWLSLFDFKYLTDFFRNFTFFEIVRIYMFECLSSTFICPKIDFDQMSSILL